MLVCFICIPCRSHRPQQINPRQQHPSPQAYDLTTELEDPRKFSLNLLCHLVLVGNTPD